MLLTTTENIPGHKIRKVLGLVQGSTVRTRHLGHDIMAHIKNVVGGEVMEYTKMLAESREQVLDRMIGEAMEQGATAIIGIRFVTSEIMQGASELLVYGTAVLSEREE
ncbi:MAG: YbjQ family protein [bacterium]|nr:YbjQ family protein [bacterium]